MNFSRLNVGARLGAGFALVLVACGVIGFVGWQRVGQLNKAMTNIAVNEWETARTALEIDARQRDNFARTGELLVTSADHVSTVAAEIAENRKFINESFDRLERLVDEADGKEILQGLTEARGAYVGELEKIVKAVEGGNRAEATRIYLQSMPKLDASLEKVHELVEFQDMGFDAAYAESEVQAVAAGRLILAAMVIALVAGIALALLLTRGIVKPLRSAMDVAEAIGRGKLDNQIDTGGTDETGRLLQSLDSMQGALRARDEKDADFRGQIAAIGRSQAVIEFDMDGTVREVNDNFTKVMGYTRAEAVGKHHSHFVESGQAASGEFRAFWERLNRGQFEVSTCKRVAKGGREVWLQASYNPILDLSGKPFKVVKYATDVTAEMVRNADFAGQLTAIGRSQAVVEFEMDGTVRKINDNFARVMGYSQGEVVGKHHSMFVDAAVAGGAEYRAFWAKLNRGEAEVNIFRRIAKGGREVWLQSSYNPIPDANGKPFKVVKYASDVTPQMQAQQQLQVAVEQTQDSVKYAIEGDLTHRVPMEGKSGELEVLCRGVNSLLESTSDLVRRVKGASSEVQMGAQEISRGNTNLSQRTEEQASSLEETASSMEEMTATVRQTADNAAQANQLALAARQQAEKGGSVVSSAVTAMGAINDASKKIADIIGVIDEIAFQTNLLALNAAVEAARAGEQGRGFAVVATEVRNLAGRSATAAKEIKTLIQDSVVKVDEGSKLVDESGKTLDEIVQAVKKVTDIVAEIAAASREQSSGIDQVNKAVMAMDSATQQNAALVEEAAAASQAIVEQAHALTGMVERYNVGAMDTGASVKQAPVKLERRSKDRPWTKSPMAAGNSATPPAARKAAGSEAEWNEF